MDIPCDFLISCEKAACKRELLVSIELGLDYFAMAFLPVFHERLDNDVIWERWPRAWLGRATAPVGADAQVPPKVDTA